jgi:hypothetical protein
MIVSNKLKNNETIICENCAVVIASALSQDTRGARWEEFSREIGSAAIQQRRFFRTSGSRS